MLGESKALGNEVVVDDGEGAGGKEVGGDVEVAGITGSSTESSLGKAMGRYVCESCRED